MATLFTTEMWERFSFYGMKALLVPFLISAFQLTESTAKEALGTYVLLVYLSPLFAGIIADRFLNLRMSIYVGAIVMAIGHFAMAFRELTFVGMALIIAGNGFFKPCATNMVGALYPTDHPKRTSMYSLFYFGINLGAFISPFVCGWLREHYNAEWGFAAAGIGMVLGLVIFACFEHTLETAGFRDDEQIDRTAGKIRIGRQRWARVLTVSLLTTLLVAAMAWGRHILDIVWTPRWLLGEKISSTVLFLIRMGVVAVLLWCYVKLVPRTEATRRLDSDEKQRIWVIAAITFAMFFLVLALEQAGGTLNLFAKDKTQPTFLGFAIPYEFYQAVNPLAVMLFSLVTMWLWPVLERRGLNDLQKLGPGLLIVAVVFFVEKAMFAITADGTKASPSWLLTIYFLLAASEVCISVIGLSAVNKLAPGHMKAFFTAVFFLAIACGGYLAGTVDAILSELHLDPWYTLGVVCSALGLLYILSAKALKRLAHGVI